MIKRYFELEAIVRETAFAQDPKLTDCLLSAKENRKLKEVFENMKQLHSVTIMLQKEDLDLVDVRLLFDEVLQGFPDEDSFKKYLLPDSQLVHQPVFEAAVRKISTGQVLGLEERKVEVLSVESTESASTGNEPAEDFAMMKKQKLRVERKYLNCKFILPTSNIVERFFSTAGYAFNDGQRLTPTKLENQLFLKLNKAMWNEDVVNEVMNSPAAP